MYSDNGAILRLYRLYAGGRGEVITITRLRVAIKWHYASVRKLGDRKPKLRRDPLR